MTLQIEFVSQAALRPMDEQKKMNYILKSVKRNKIVVLDGMLSPAEEKNLIQETMRNIDGKFPGIEISILGNSEEDLRVKLIRLLGGTVGGMTVIGPSKLVKEIKKDPNRLNMLASVGD
ncbi:MAG: DUF2073 domain-containing protein [Candidatus Micrarchaeota archaeon]